MALEIRVSNLLPLVSFATRQGGASDADLAALEAEVATKADKATTITGGGLATGGGDLSANRVVTVPKATAAEASALTNDTKAITPLALAGPINDLSTALDTRLDALEGGAQFKTAVRVATTANGTLATAFENGDTIDGVVLATGDRILLKNQTAAAENGIYTVNASGAPTRATDADTGAELVMAAVSVSTGTANGGTQWRQATVAPITLGTTAINWVKLVDQSAVDAEVIAAKAPEATLKLRLDNTLVGGSSTATYVDETGYAGRVVDAAGRNLVSWDGEGTLADSHGLVQELHKQMSLYPNGPVDNLPWISTNYTFTHWMGFSVQGQSNASASNSGPLTTTQPFNNKRAQTGAPITLVETTYETSTSGAANHAKWRVLKAMRPWNTWALDYDWVANQMGAAGTVLTGISKGTAPYNGGITRETGAKNAAVAAGKTYAARAIIFIHGETDATNGTNKIAYRDGMIQLKNDWNTDVAAITGQTDRIPMFVIQQGLGDSGFGANHEIGLIMFEAAELDPEIIVIAPGYRFYCPGGHYDNWSQRMIGEYAGKALHRYWIEKRNPSTVKPIAWTLVNSRTIEVTFYVPVPPLVFDMDNWPMDVGLGFAIYTAADTGTAPNSANEIAISDVRIIPGNKVRIITTADVTPGCFLTYADKFGIRGRTGGIGSGWRIGPRGCLRDSDLTASYYPDQYGALMSLPNWCVAFRKTLT